MTFEQERPRLLGELADDHVVGSPPVLERGDVQFTSIENSRPKLRTKVAVAARCAVLIGGLLAVGAVNSDRGSADSSAVASPDADNSPPGSSLPSTSGPDSTISDVISDVGADAMVSSTVNLIRIEADTGREGTTRVVLVFDADLPSGGVDILEDVSTPLSTRVGYTTQSSGDAFSAISICGNSHWFPAPGIRMVDILIPSDWFEPQVPIEVEYVFTGPGAKIPVCEPLNGVVQVSIGGSASGRIQDVTVSANANTITVDITPDLTGPPVGDGAIDGPVIRNSNQSEFNYGLAAEIRGVLELEEDCLYVAFGEVGERYPIVWPASTTWNSADTAVVLPSGESLAIGDNLYGSGGYISVENVEQIAFQQAAELAGRCVDNQYGEIAVVNNYDVAIGPG